MADIVEFYAKNLRGISFSGFLTMTGFLFTLHTFLLVTLHRDIYGRDDYQKWVIQTARRYNPSLRPLKPLRNVSRVLFATLAFSFATSIAQLTFGLIEATWAVVICLGLVAITSVLFLVTLLMFRRVVCDWLDFVEKQAEDRFGPQSQGQATNSDASPSTPSEETR